MKKKHGIVILLDALGASSYSEMKIKQFLSARSEINSTIKRLSSKQNLKVLGPIGKFHTPVIFTFGDTVVITIELNTKKYLKTHIFIISVLLQMYLYESMQNGILFRGAFSIGNYIADKNSNTVMGDALIDAAAWYEQADWAGVSSTPKTNYFLEHLFSLSDPVTALSKFSDEGIAYYKKYDVPMQNGESIPLYAINWPSAFFDEELLKRENQKNGERYFLELMRNLSMPRGTEKKYQNTKSFFYTIAKEIANK